MKINIIVTLGKSTSTEAHLRKFKDQGVAFVRVNMSHSTVDDLKFCIGLAKKVGIPFIIDTEGSQIRTGRVKDSHICIEEGSEIKIYKQPILGDQKKICLTPKVVVDWLEPGDILRLDFNTLILRVSDISTSNEGFILARAITGGTLGNNKGVIVDPAFPKKCVLPALSKKDFQSIKIGLKEGVDYIAASFMRDGSFVDDVRHATQGKMKIISKIECIDGLEHLDEIVEKSDAVLVDRGDLGKEIPLERISLTQKIIVNRTCLAGKKAIIATNLLETMIENPRPTKAEIHDILTSILDGASGLALCAETAIGKYPFECVNVIQKLIAHITETFEKEEYYNQNYKLVQKLNKEKYLLDFNGYVATVVPHGGKLINRCVSVRPKESFLRSLPKIKLNKNQLMDLEQIAIGTFSPLEGFMSSQEVESVLNKMILPSGVICTIPVILDVSEKIANSVTVGKSVALLNGSGKIIGLLYLKEKYIFNKRELINKLYGTQDENHPGVRLFNNLQPVFLAGKIDLYERNKTATQEYELTPLQVRRIFEEKNWNKIVGFHTRNVIHKSHEYIQLKALDQEFCDGLFIHPAIGQKESGDFQPKYIIDSYKIMMRNFYPKGQVLFAVLATYSRYAGPREAIFTALCRKNFGCSHFIICRDHARVDKFYSSDASHKIFDKFLDLGIKPVKFSNIFYSKKIKAHVHEIDRLSCNLEKGVSISGTRVREILNRGKTPPKWFMRPEISKMILNAINTGRDVFVK